MRRIVGVVVAALALVGCESSPVVLAPTYPPAPARPAYMPPPPDSFREADFTWSLAPGSSRILGTLYYRSDRGLKYTCQGGDVILSPETPWSRARTQQLYLSTTSAALPVEDVKSRTRAEHGAEYARYVRKATCNANNRFVFKGLPNGAWYMITIASPVGGVGPRLAMMRRVLTSGGDVTSVFQ